MGFQWVLAVAPRETTRLLVFNGELAFDFSAITLIDGDDPADILANGRRVIQRLREPRSPVVGRTEPSTFVLLANRVQIAAASSAAAPTVSAPQIAQPSSLVKKVTLGGRRVFHRYTGFNPDRRIDPATGDFVPGTFCTPESELPFLETAFAAVSRLALPNVQPAVHHHVIDVDAGTTVEFGTIAPAFGQAGGGVEAFLPDGGKNQLNPRRTPSRLPDE
jgi:hypothetical protein